METPTNPDNRYGKRPVWQWVAIYLVLAAIIYGLYYFLVLNKNAGYGLFLAPQSSPTVTAGPTVTLVPPSPSPASSSASVSSSPAGTPTVVPQQISVNGTEYAFSPPAFTVKAGEPVKLTFTNNGTYPHDFVIGDLNVRTKTLQPGDRETVAFTPETAGKYTYVCTVPGHEDQGMKGTMTVQ